MLRPGDVVMFHPYPVDGCQGLGPYPAVVEAVYWGNSADLDVHLGDGNKPVRLLRIEMGDGPGQFKPMVDRLASIVARLPKAQPKATRKKKKAKATKPARKKPAKIVPLFAHGTPRGHDPGAMMADAFVGVEDEPDEDWPEAEEPEYLPSAPVPRGRISSLSRCLLCMRLHRGEGPYCGERCEDRAAVPAGNDLRRFSKRYKEARK